MTSSVVAVLREGILLALLLAAPFLVASLIAGVITGIVGAVTQVQDPSIGMLPRVAAVGAAIALFGPSIATQLQAFANTLWPLITAAGTAS